MSLKLGTTAIKLPFSKAYLGSVLKYQKEVSGGMPFNICPFPIEWAEVTPNLEYTASNEYGNWRITANTCYSNSYPVYEAFDSNETSFYRPEDLNTNGYLEVIIETPCAIKPSIINIVYAFFKADAVIEGYNAEANTWETLVNSLEASTSTKITASVNVNANNFYTKFRIYTKRYSSSYNKPRLYEFQITSGELKI